MKNTLKYALFLGVAGLLIWYAFKDIPLNELFEQFKKADYTWVWASVALTFVAHASRAYRWCMLMEPLGYKPSFLNANLAVWTGYFANYIIPRMGEVTRCGTLQKTDDVPFEKSFGTVVAERVFDVITLLVLIGLNFLLEFDRLSQFFTDFFVSKLQGNAQSGPNYLLYGIVGVGLLGGIAVLYLIFNKNTREKLLQNALVKKVWDFGVGLLDGLLSIRKLRRPWLFVFHTLLIWAMYYLMSYVLFFATPETSQLSALAGLTLLVVGAIGMTAPTQGGIGAYHLLVGSVMVLYGLTQQSGILLATFIHGIQLVLTLFVGAAAFVAVLFIQRRTR
ncbi:MAG: flippase-like domain-containing protein [Spirosomaceae bacterium]|jgi:hypothetical protein|nr:flippase-like domain-containing protein [Spirosomataceae bacterium]